MTKIKILIEGYAKEIKNGWVASSTVTLIKAGSKNIIVDPGCNRNKLIAALAKENLKINDINFVLLTHGHIDHTLLCGIFPNAKVLTSDEIYSGDNQTTHKNIIPGTDLEIIPTPGHCPEHCSLIIPSKSGVYIVAGDAFWWTDKEKQIINTEKVDSAHLQEVNMIELIESRKKILKIADWIIPGHGKMFKVEK